MSQAPEIFSPALRRMRLERAAGNFSDHDFLHERAADDALDRLETVKKRFEQALFHGPGGPLLSRKLTPAADVGNITFAGESAAFLVAQGAETADEVSAADLPYDDARFDLVVSLMSLHAESDLPRALAEARRVLMPDGLFVAVFPAEQTLAPLRQALRDAESELSQGVGPRVLPFVAIKDAGALLQRAGFALPVVDTQPVTVRYREPIRLFQDLRGMGETSSLVRGPRGALRRDVLARAVESLRGVEIPFELTALTGWAPHPSQQQPLKPGSGKVSMADAILKGQAD